MAPTENMVITRSEFWSCQQAMEMSHQGGHIVCLLCVWIIEDMHTYPKLNSVAVLGRTKNAYWQSQFLCSSSSLHNTPGSQQNTEQVDTSKVLRRSALFLDSQIVLTLGCAALRFRGCVIGGHGRLAQQPIMTCHE